MNNRTTNLTQAAANLAKSSPSIWPAFLKEIDNLRKATVDNLITSPDHDLKVQQGKAQMLTELTSLLTDCVTTADKIAGKANK